MSLIQNDMVVSTVKPFKITVDNHGLFALHNMPCAVYNEESAVYSCATGNFHPSWKAKKEGWELVRAKTKFQKFLLSAFFRD